MYIRRDQNGMSDMLQKEVGFTKDQVEYLPVIKKRSVGYHTCLI